MQSLDAQPSRPLRTLLLAIIVVAVIVIGAALLRGGAPNIDAADVPATVGGHKPVQVDIHAGAGIARVSAYYLQSGKRIPLADEERPAHHWFSNGSLPAQETLTLQAGRLDNAGLEDGPAELVIDAQAGNLRGSSAHVERMVTVRSTPPRIAILSGELYLNQGGCEMVIYRLSPGTTDSEVVMGGARFPGYALPGATPGTMFSVFAFPYDAPADSLPQLIAHDAAGNEATAALPVKTFPKVWRNRVLDIDDAYINRVVMPIIAQTPSLSDQGTPLKNFLLVNRGLRVTDEQQLEAAAGQTVPKFLWHGVFVQLHNGTVEAEFADHRSYRYENQIVDQEYHLGYDLAAVRHTPVPAANAGRVVWAKYFGIYGNCILIDHGFGLMSLYAHLNDFAVKAGDTVQTGQIIGHSDSTGLAGGDHLHFSMLLAGQQVNPIEWWDAHWIQDHIQSKIDNFTGAQPSGN